jgi:hypothetical protein
MEHGRSRMAGGGWRLEDRVAEIFNAQHSTPSIQCGVRSFECGEPFDKLRAGTFDRLRDDFPIRPPQTGLEIILKVVFHDDFAPSTGSGLGSGNWMASRTNSCAIPNGGEKSQ